jgi:Ran GTPase-activating protein (RanGAP) involved in mRNA processing and transport
MPTYLETLLSSYFHAGKPQTMHIVIADNRKQQTRVERLLQTVASKAFVELRPLAGDVESTNSNKQSSEKAADRSGGGGGGAGHGFDIYTKKRVWAYVSYAERKSDDLVRQAAVGVFCARTYECCPLFKIILLVSSVEYAQLAPIAKLLSGHKKGFSWVCNLQDSDTDDPSLEPNEYGIVPDTKMHIEENTLETMVDYANVENGTGDIAILQEAVFNNDPAITAVRYDERFGEGAPFIRILRDALKFNIVVHTLDLTGSFAGDVACVALTSILHTSRKLKTICLRETSLTDVGMTHLAAALRKSECVTSLNISRNPSITDVGLIALTSVFSSGSLTNIQDLDISSNNAIYDQTRMWSDRAVEMLFDSLAERGRIESLTVAGCALQPSHFTHMAAKWLANGGGERLKVLRCQHNIIEDEALALLLQYAPNLTYLDLEHTGLTAVGFRVLGKYVSRKDSQLQWLKLDTNNSMLRRPLPDVLHPLLNPETVLAMKDDDGHAATVFVNNLFGNKTLSTLSACRINIGDEAVVAICDLMSTRQCALQHLDIASNCNIEETCAHKIKELLVGGFLTDEESAARDAQWAAGNESAPVLSLSLCGNSPAIGERALLAMYANRGLQSFDVSNTGIVDAMLMPLNEGIRTNPFLRLRVLKIGRNTLYADGVRHLAEHVKGSKYLVELSLDDTWRCFTDVLGQESCLSRTLERGAVFLGPLLLALAIQPSPSLRRLDLSANDITDPIAKMLSAAVSANTNLDWIDLQQNPISDDAATALDSRINLKRKVAASPRRAMRLMIQ